jgi:hypothetical protein
MSVDAAQAEFLDEPLPESPLKDRLAAALPKAPAGLQWVVASRMNGEEVLVELKTRKGAYQGAKVAKVLAADEDRIISLIANAAKDLMTEHNRCRILAELSGAYEGEVAA